MLLLGAFLRFHVGEHVVVDLLLTVFAYQIVDLPKHFLVSFTTLREIFLLSKQQYLLLKFIEMRFEIFVDLPEL